MSGDMVRDATVTTSRAEWGWWLVLIICAHDRAQLGAPGHCQAERLGSEYSDHGLIRDWDWTPGVSAMFDGFQKGENNTERRP